jgi:hypothetical protein
VRFIRGNRTLSPTVFVQIPSSAAPGNLLWEQLPSGLTPTKVSHGGQWNPASRTLQWQNLAARSTISYGVTGSTNAYPLSGVITSAGQLEVTVGETTAMVHAPLDSDGDGLPDWWEKMHFDSRTTAVAEVDSDNDGQSNLAEFLAGTHPLDGGFQAQQWAPFLRNFVVNDEVATMQIVGFEGAAHRIEESADLKTWRVAGTNLLSGQTLAVTRKNLPEVEAVFYRAVVEER